MSFSIPETGSAAGASGIASYGADYLVKDDGSLWVWGDTKSVPTQVQGLTDVQASFPMWNSALIVTKDLSVWKWETNAKTLALDVTPVAEMKNLTDLISMNTRRVAVTGEGMVYTAVPTPDGTYETPFSPVTGIDNVAALSGYYENNKQAYWQRFLFLKSDGTVWTSFDELTTFTQIQNLHNIVKLEQNYALSQDGSVWTWPIQNSYEPETLSDPALVTATPMPGLTDIHALYNNGRTRLAIDGQSRLWFWGSTVTGYSDGTTYADQPLPIAFSGISKVTDAYIVEHAIVALTSDGKVYAASIEAAKMTPDAP
ncbi:hypothetical protein KC345_g11749, partial [Hortaea werneckii]